MSMLSNYLQVLGPVYMEKIASAICGVAIFNFPLYERNSLGMLGLF